MYGTILSAAGCNDGDGEQERESAHLDLQGERN
jgi:hypothetical protein